MSRRYLSFIGAFGLFLLVGASGGAPAQAATSHQQITGSGSSWAANAVNQWVSDVDKQGLQVVFTSAGSAQGRQDFANKSTDFGVSDIAYQGKDPETGTADTSNGRDFAYLPIVAGGTSFPYHLGNGATQIRNLRLSGPTLVGIFTNQITNWDDPKIAADNNNALHLPNLQIIPVVHSEGSGSTAQFTQYMAKDYPSQWTAYNHGSDTFTEYYPKAGAQVGQNGSDGVMNFITSAAGNGTIGFDEYSYPLLANFPVAKILNSAGYYTAPTQYNVAVALTQAQINNDPSSADYLTQTLDKVYVNPDARTYPLSSYSYAIIPTSSSDSKTSKTAARQTIADFMYYSICQGQGEIGPIGYSALPVNLVTDGFSQIAKLKQADPAVDLTQRAVSTCNNPTFDPSNLNLNKLAEIAPQPPACDKQGAGPCNGTTGLANANPVNGQAPAGAKGGTGTGTGATSSTSVAPSASTSASVDPNTGELLTGGASNVANVQAGSAAATEVSDTAADSGLSTVLSALAILLLLVLIAIPVPLARYFAGRRR